MLSKNEKDTLYDIDERILLLEKRLDNAKISRDSFLQHLRGKYPSWRPPLPTPSYQDANFPHYHRDPIREPLLGRLSTSNYQWDMDKVRRDPPRIPNFPNSQIHDIPTSGPLLESDLRRSKIRLREISEELRALRMDRMSLSTAEWMQNEQFRQHKSIRLSLSTDSPRQVDHLDEARSRLATIEFTEHSPVETPTQEKKIELEMKEMQEKMIEDIRNGKIPMGEPKYPDAPAVRFQEPVAVAEPEPVIPAPIAVPAPAPVVAPTVVQAPPQPTTSSLLSGLFSKDSDSDSDDSPRKPAPKPAPKATSSAKPYDTSFLKSFGAQDSGDEADMFSRKAKPKSIMFKDDDDVDDFFM